MTAITNQVQVRIGNETRTFNLVVSESGNALVSVESYGVRYRTGTKRHERKIVFMLNENGLPTSFDFGLKKQVPVDLTNPVDLSVTKSFAYGNRNSVEIPYFFR